jgi:hypothetical protein
MSLWKLFHRVHDRDVSMRRSIFGEIFPSFSPKLFPLRVPSKLPRAAAIRKIQAPSQSSVRISAAAAFNASRVPRYLPVSLTRCQRVTFSRDPREACRRHELLVQAIFSRPTAGLSLPGLYPENGSRSGNPAAALMSRLARSTARACAHAPVRP